MIGADEVGRGALAGPLLFCAVRLNKEVRGLADSKAINRKQRERLYETIVKYADIGYGYIDATEIDRIGLAKALAVACNEAVGSIQIAEDEKIIIDGNIDYINSSNSGAVIKADTFVSAVSAASIVAKVTRDKLMHEMSVIYPEYGFIRNVGYGTQSHIKAIKLYGYTPIHRKSYKLKGTS